MKQKITSLPCFRKYQNCVEQMPNIQPRQIFTNRRNPRLIIANKEQKQNSINKLTNSQCCLTKNNTQSSQSGDITYSQNKLPLLMQKLNQFQTNKPQQKTQTETYIKGKLSVDLYDMWMYMDYYYEEDDY